MTEDQNNKPEGNQPTDQGETPAPNTSPNKQPAPTAETSSEATAPSEAKAAASPEASSAPARPSLGRIAKWLGFAALALIALAIALIIGWQAAPQLTDAWQSQTQADADATDEGDAAEGQWYISGMHPWIVSPEPGNCPICGMELTPLDPDQLSAQIAIDPTVIQNIGLTTAPVTTGPITQQIRTVGNVAYAEDAIRRVNLRTAGWVRTLHVDQLGQRVEQGQPLLTLYSPELVAAQREYIVALRAATAADAHGNLLGNPEDARRLVEAARRRLTYLGLTEEQIATLKQSVQDQGDVVEDDGQAADPVQDTITIHSPHAGVVTAKNVTEGQRVEPGAALFEIANLDTVWVQATLYEQHLAAVDEGMTATVTVPQLPEATFEGTVAQVYPYMADVGRSARVRIELPNTDGRLRPGMFATVNLTGQLHDGQPVTLAPREAILVTGDRAIAFVRQGRGEFEPRDVTMGQTTTAGLTHITAGLEPGEQVVTNGIFLLDSEARTREGLARMMQPAKRDDAGASPTEPPVPAGGSLGTAPDWLDVTGAQQAVIDRVFEAYFKLGSNLAGKDATAAARAMTQLRDASIGIDTDAPSPVRNALQTIAELANTNPGDATLESMRSRTERITEHTTALAKVAPPTQDVAPAVYRTYCPMVEKHWLQDAPEIENLYAPYMLTCGEVVEQFPTRQAAAPATQPATTQPAEGGGS